MSRPVSSGGIFYDEELATALLQASSGHLQEIRLNIFRGLLRSNISIDDTVQRVLTRAAPQLRALTLLGGAPMYQSSTLPGTSAFQQLFPLAVDLADLHTELPNLDMAAILLAIAALPHLTRLTLESSLNGAVPSFEDAMWFILASHASEINLPGRWGREWFTGRRALRCSFFVLMRLTHRRVFFV